MIRRITCEAVQVQHAGDAPHLINRAIRAALCERKPAYIEIPCNLSKILCSEPVALEALMPSVKSDPKALATAVDTAAKLLNGAQKPVLLAGSKLRSYGAMNAFRELAEALGCAVAMMPDAKGFFPEEHPQFIGVYWGSVSSPGCEPVMNGADMILAAGPMVAGITMQIRMSVLSRASVSSRKLSEKPRTANLEAVLGRKVRALNCSPVRH